MKILLLGNGAREHAIADKLKQNPDVTLYNIATAHNPGLVELCEEIKIGDYNNADFVKKYSDELNPDIVWIGPEAPLGAGIVDALDVPCVGPTQELAQLETSKSFTRDLLVKKNILAYPEFKTFTSEEGLEEFCESLEKFVVKPDGLTGGKGVRVQDDHFNSHEEGIVYAKECLKTDGKVIIEDKLIGQEFSLMSFADGKNLLHMPAVQDHKRAYVDDEGPNCYSSDTEILTANGWKKFNQLGKNDKVMTFDLKTKELKLRKPSKIYWMKYNGEMIHFQHRELDLLVTPNHRMLARNRKTKRVSVFQAEDYVGENEIFLTGAWKGKSPKYFHIDEYDYKFNRKLKNQNINFIDWVRFMGLFLSEGYITDNKKEHRVLICQVEKSKHFKDFEKILSKLPFNFIYDKKSYKFRINSIQLVKILKQFGNSKNKFIPDYIKNADKKHIMKFLKAFALGDGSVHNGNLRFHSASKKLIDDIQELVLKTGHSSIITVDKRNKMLNPINKKYYKASSVYSLEIKLEKVVGIRKRNIKKVNYKGYVGCVTVPSGFVVVRRNNRVAISGNTGGMGSYSAANGSMPFLLEGDIEMAQAINQQVLEALGDYRGILYGNFIATKNGLKIIEYNARLGDPEAINIMYLLKNDLAIISQGIVDQSLEFIKIEFEKKASVCKYVVPEGYPDKPVKDVEIDVSEVDQTKVKLYYASVDVQNGKMILKGSRAIGVVAKADTLDEAEKLVQNEIVKIKGPVFFREDIGTAPLIEKRVQMMQEVRK